ncbi:MAG: flagellar hook-associated protein 1 FlgK [Planctomycetota bacterium]|jgi:flagellar hook-associated protein 1 FlgK
MGIGLNTGLKALLAAQASLQTTGHNISNASTPGFSRQRLSVSASAGMSQRGLLIGSGVSADFVSRSADALLLVRTTKQVSSLSRLDSALGGMSEVEALLAEPSDFGLSAGLSDFFASISTLSTATEDLVFRSGMVQKTTAMTTQLNQLSSTMSSIRRDTASQVRIQTREVNGIAEQIVVLNREIGRTEASGVPANDLRDQREQRLRDLSSYIDVQHHEDESGVLRVTTGGRMLVGGADSLEMNSVIGTDGSVKIFLEGSGIPVQLKRGKIAGLVQVSDEFIPGLQNKIDLLSKNMIYEMNRVHSTGTPDSGTFRSLTSSYQVKDTDLDGQVMDELISDSGLPFGFEKGELHVNVTHLATGELGSSKIDLDPKTTTVGDFVEALNGVDGLNATVNSFNRIQVFTDAGFGYDFASRLDNSPDKAGTLGSAHASLGSGAQGPYSLTAGDTLDLTGPVGTFSVTFNATEFEEMSVATAEEMADVLNANTDMLANGLRATVTDDRLYIQTAATGPTSTFTVNGGTSLAALSISAGTVTTGATTSVDLQISGSYIGEKNDSFSFVPRTDGTVGTTPGLNVDVFSASGQLVATLDVGDSYQPGTDIEVSEGISVSFGLGTLSATDFDSAKVDLIAESDTSGVLAAFGINSLFTGSSAADIDVRAELVDDPSMIAAGSTSAAGDNSTLLRLMDVQSKGLTSLNNETIGNFYGDAVSNVGFEISQVSMTREVESFLLQNLETRREETSGVNIDEELVNMVRFEENFNAASRFIQVLNALSDEVLRLI